MLDPMFLATYGLPGLFALAFLAGSVVPIPSEVAMIALLLGGAEPYMTVGVAASGNLLGAATLFWIGRRMIRGRLDVTSGFARRLLGQDPRRYERSVKSMRRWGPAALLLSWVPILGDLLVVAAGAVGVRVLPFLVFTSLGKTARFGAVAFAALAAAGS